MVTIESGKKLNRTVGFLDRERIIAGAGFNRWLVPPAALAIHLCIGMAVFRSRMRRESPAANGKRGLLRSRKTRTREAKGSAAGISIVR